MSIADNETLTERFHQYFDRKTPDAVRVVFLTWTVLGGLRVSIDSCPHHWHVYGYVPNPTKGPITTEIVLDYDCSGVDLDEIEEQAVQALERVIAVHRERGGQEILRMQ